MSQKRLNTPEKRARIGERIKLASTQAGLTLKDLAEATGVKPTLIYQYVRGITLIPNALLEKIAAVTRVHTDFFDPDADARTTFALPSDLPAPAGTFAPRIPEPSTQDRLRAEYRHLYELTQAHNAPKRNRAAYIASLEQMLGLARAADNRQQEGWALATLGRAHIENNHPEEALQHLVAARDIFAGEGMKEYSALAALDLAYLLSDWGRFDAAQSYLDEVILVDNTDLRWRGLISLGSLRFRQNQYGEALEYFRQAAATLETTEGAQREEGMLELRNHIADVVRATGHYEDAMRLWTDCLQQAASERKAEAFLESLMEIAQCCQMMGRINEAKQRLEMAVVLAGLLFEDEARLGIARALLAEVLTAMGALDESRENARAAIRIAAKTGGARSAIVSALALSESLLAAGQWEDALAYSKDALDEAKRTRRTREEAQTHELRARAHLAQAAESERLGDKQEAETALNAAFDEARTALAQATQADAVKERIATHLTLARCHLRAVEDDAASEHLRAAQELNEQGAVGINRLLGKEAENLSEILRGEAIDLPAAFSERRVALPAMEWQTHYLNGTLLAKQHGSHAAFAAMSDAARAVGRILAELSPAETARFAQRNPEIEQMFRELQQAALSDSEKSEANSLLTMAHWVPMSETTPLAISN